VTLTYVRFGSFAGIRHSLKACLLGPIIGYRSSMSKCPLDGRAKISGEQ
jgi:hypothetical protein